MTSPIDSNLPPAALEALERLRPELEREDRATSAAKSLPAPGPLLAAFRREPVPAPGLPGRTLRPITMGDVITLQWLNSPLIQLRQVIAANAGKSEAELRAVIDAEVKFDEQQIAEAAFVLLESSAIVNRAIGHGRDGFALLARNNVLDAIAPVDMQPLLLAAFSVFTAGFATRVEFAAPPRTDGDGAAGNFPKPPPTPMMDSAGGSTFLAR